MASPMMEASMVSAETELLLILSPESTAIQAESFAAANRCSSAGTQFTKVAPAIGKLRLLAPSATTVCCLSSYSAIRIDWSRHRRRQQMPPMAVALLSMSFYSGTRIEGAVGWGGGWMDGGWALRWETTSTLDAMKSELSGCGRVVNNGHAYLGSRCRKREGRKSTSHIRGVQSTAPRRSSSADGYACRDGCLRYQILPTVLRPGKQQVHCRAACATPYQCVTQRQTSVRRRGKRSQSQAGRVEHERQLEQQVKASERARGDLPNPPTLYKLHATPYQSPDILLHRGLSHATTSALHKATRNIIRWITTRPMARSSRCKKSSPTATAAQPSNTPPSLPLSTAMPLPAEATSAWRILTKSRC